MQATELAATLRILVPRKFSQSVSPASNKKDNESTSRRAQVCPDSLILETHLSIISLTASQELSQLLQFLFTKTRLASWACPPVHWLS